MKTVLEMAREAGAVFPADGSYHKFDAWVGSEVDTKRFVVRSCDYVLGTEKYILRKDAWALVVHPTEWRVGMAFAR